jgi:hypothetical protein
LKPQQIVDVWDIPVELLKDGSSLLSKQISDLINAIFSKKQVPCHLKFSRIIPKFKSGDKNDFSNYRPIANLSSFAKIFDIALKNRIEAWLEKNGVLSEKQFAYRKNTSCIEALEEMLGTIVHHLDEGKCVAMVNIDFRRAFENLHHGLLLDKMESDGIRGHTRFNRELSHQSNPKS